MLCQSANAWWKVASTFGGCAKWNKSYAKIGCDHIVTFLFVSSRVLQKNKKHSHHPGSLQYYTHTPTHPASKLQQGWLFFCSLPWSEMQEQHWNWGLGAPWVETMRCAGGCFLKIPASLYLYIQYLDITTIRFLVTSSRNNQHALWHHRELFLPQTFLPADMLPAASCPTSLYMQALRGPKCTYLT